MATVRFTKHLIRFFPDLANQSTIEAQGDTVAGVVAALDEQYPGLAAYVVDEQGALRKHVNIFLDDELIHDRQKLQDPVTADDRIYIFQALSGG
ncbi:MAG: molybdenum cofactor biosynthesis protein MoaD [Chloroflexi bacterium]|jgi:molybdopterin converting factor small subunit|nr:molybdenum cofactor biosynthesis protein MoaD [Chloroflexota bacterium]